MSLVKYPASRAHLYLFNCVIDIYMAHALNSFTRCLLCSSRGSDSQLFKASKQKHFTSLLVIQYASSASRRSNIYHTANKVHYHLN